MEVIHVKNARRTPDEVWIGPDERNNVTSAGPGYFWTPVVVGVRCIVCGDTHHDAASTLPCYKMWLDWRLPRDDTFCHYVKSLVGRTLVCKCKPDPCHGEILIDAVKRLTGDIQFSPSAIDTAWLCLRKWAFRAIDKAPKESTEAAKLGDDVHKVRENWLLYGVAPTDSKPGKLARVGLEFLPPPKYAMVERIMRLPIVGKRYAISGRIDFFVPNVPMLTTGEKVMHQRVWGTPGIPLVGDHKTAGVNKKTGADWGKTAEQLQTNDAQGACYGAWGLWVTGAPAVDLHWSYMIKSTPYRPRQVYARLAYPDVVKTMTERILPTTDHLLTILETPGMTANQVTPNPSACDAYGGCPYLDRCAISKQERLEAIFS